MLHCLDPILTISCTEFVNSLNNHLRNSFMESIFVAKNSTIIDIGTMQKELYRQFKIKMTISEISYEIKYDKHFAIKNGSMILKKNRFNKLFRQFQNNMELVDEIVSSYSNLRKIQNKKWLLSHLWMRFVFYINSYSNISKMAIGPLEIEEELEECFPQDKYTMQSSEQYQKLMIKLLKGSYCYIRAYYENRKDYVLDIPKNIPLYLSKEIVLNVIGVNGFQKQISFSILLRDLVNFGVCLKISIDEKKQILDFFQCFNNHFYGQARRIEPCVFQKSDFKHGLYKQCYEYLRRNRNSNIDGFIEYLKNLFDKFLDSYNISCSGKAKDGFYACDNIAKNIGGVSLQSLCYIIYRNQRFVVRKLKMARLMETFHHQETVTNRKMMIVLSAISHYAKDDSKKILMFEKVLSSRKNVIKHYDYAHLYSETIKYLKELSVFELSKKNEFVNRFDDVLYYNNSAKFFRYIILSCVNRL